MYKGGVDDVLPTGTSKRVPAGLKEDRKLYCRGPPPLPRDIQKSARVAWTTTNDTPFPGASVKLELLAMRCTGKEADSAQTLVAPPNWILLFLDFAFFNLTKKGKRKKKKKTRYTQPPRCRSRKRKPRARRAPSPRPFRVLE